MIKAKREGAMDTYNRILDKLLPEWQEHFRAKHEDYSNRETIRLPSQVISVKLEPHRILGKAGQFADIWRKIWKLYKALWLHEALEGEQPREILLDLIGHCFLTLALIDEEEQAEAGIREREQVLCDSCEVIWVRVASGHTTCNLCRKKKVQVLS
jgi:hypothetical protein